MAIQDKNTLKTYFETGDLPSQNQFTDLIDSLKHENDTLANLSKQEMILMANRLASIDNGFVEYYAGNIGNSIVVLDVAQQNAENQLIKISDTADNNVKQYFLGDAPYTISLKEFQGEKLGATEYYYMYWRINQYYGFQKLFGNTLPDIPEGFEFGVPDGKRFYFQILKSNIGQQLKVVHSNIKFVNNTGVSIEYRAEAGNWSDRYKKEDTVTDHYNVWDYLYFYYKADMTNETETIVCTIYNLDTKELVATTTLTPGQNYQNTGGGNTIPQARNILIECKKQSLVSL